MLGPAKVPFMPTPHSQPAASPFDRPRGLRRRFGPDRPDPRARPDQRRPDDAPDDAVLEPPPLPAAARPATARPAAPPGEGSAARTGSPASRLFLLCTLSALDGTVAVLAAAGRLSTLGGAVGVGLTIVAGAGAWAAAHEAFGGRPGRRGVALLGLLGLAIAVATVAAAWAGAALSDLRVLPKAAGPMLLLVAAEVGGLRVPAPLGVPPSAAAAGLAVALEVLVRWTP